MCSSNVFVAVWHCSADVLRAGGRHMATPGKAGLALTCHMGTRGPNELNFKSSQYTWINILSKTGHIQVMIPGPQSVNKGLTIIKNVLKTALECPSAYLWS